MTYEELANSSSIVIGLKQVSRALKAGELKCVYIAQDADEHIRRRTLSEADAAGVRHVMVPSKKQLGTACGISVCAACAGIPIEVL